MAYIANIVTVAEMQFMAGKNRDATGDVEANHIALQKHAEGFLSALLKFKLDSAGFTSLNTTLKSIITEWAARYAGITLISFNTTGYTDRAESENMLNIHVYRLEKIEALLSKSDVQDFLSV